MDVKFNKVMKALRQTLWVSTMSANRVERLANEFATPDAFFAASREVLMKAWNRITPDGKKGLSAGFFKAFNRALELWKDTDSEPEEKEAPQKKNEARDWDSVELSLEDVSTLKDEMELHGISKIPLEEALKMLTLFKKYGGGSRGQDQKAPQS